MKRLMLVMVLITSLSMVSLAQTKWSDLTQEQKMMKAKSFRADNQAYLKNTLGMTDDQLKSIDKVNKDYLNELNKISNGAGTDDEKFAKAKDITSKRSDELDKIMGPDKHKQFSDYQWDKIQKAKG